MAQAPGQERRAMAQVFISYKHDDGDFALILKDRIEQAGFDAWIDDNVQAGEEWREMIDRAIRESMALIVILSPESVASEYVTYEWAYALGAGVPVVPVMLRQTSLHSRLDELHYLDFTNRRARPWTQLIERLESLSGSGSGKKRPRKSTRREAEWTRPQQRAIGAQRRSKRCALRSAGAGGGACGRGCWRPTQLARGRGGSARLAQMGKDPT